MLIISPFAIVLLKQYTNIGPLAVLGLFLFMLHGFSLVLLIYFTFAAVNLFRVRSQYETIQSWVKHLSLPSHFKTHQTFAIESISEFCSNRGSVLNYVLLANGNLTFVSYLCAYIYLPTVIPDLSFVVSGGAPVGLFLLSFWEKDSGNVFHSAMHMIGVAFMIGGVIGLLLEEISTDMVWFSVVLLLLFIVGSVSYTVMLSRVRMPSDDPKYINSTSRTLLLLECLALVPSILAYDTYLVVTMI